MNGYQHFKEAQAKLAALEPAAITAPRQDKPMQSLESVSSLQSRVLSLSQLDAINQIQAAMLSIGKLRVAINQLATLHSLPLKGMLLPELGDMQHTLENLLGEHGVAAAKLSNGGVPLLTGQSELRRATASALSQEAAA
jgi:hypothetical protein